MSTRLINKQTGVEEFFDESELPSALASQRYITPDAVAVHQLGEDVYAAPEQLKSAGAYTEATDPAKVARAEGHKIREDRQSGAIGALKAGVGAFVGGSTLGMVNPFEESQEFHPLAAGIGTAASYVAPFLVPGGEAELALREPTAAEHIAGAMSSRFLHAGEVGAAEGSAGRAMETSLLRGRGAKLAGEVAEEGAGRVVGSQLTPEAADRIAQMGKSDLAAARKAEIETIGQQRIPVTEKLIDDLGEHRGAYMNDDKVWLAMKSADAKEVGNVSEVAAMASKADKRIRGMLNNPKELARKPDAILSALTQQENALEKLGENETGLRKVFAGDETGARAAALDRLPAALERNRGLQARVRALLAPESSPVLDAIETARDALEAPPGKEGIASQLLGGKIFHAASEAAGALLGGIPFVGPMLGAKAAELAKHLVFGHGAKVAGEGAARAGELAKDFIGKAARGPGPSIVATRILAGARFAPDAGEAKPAGKETLATLYTKRSAELRSQTAYNAAGVPEMRPEARAAMADRIKPLRLANPLLADKVETVAARKVEFLSSKLPRRPDLRQLGPDHWQPSDMEMRQFARYVHAVENPDEVENRIAAGTVSPEDAEAYRAVYPERHKALSDALVAAMASSKAPTPYGKKLAASIFIGQPLDPSLDPRILGALQAQFAGENGSEGGSQAPKAEPAFGSVKADIGTPSQQREQVMR